ncbi:hypothetical protein CBM2617_A40232 [Cupriavidus taiwanensis]|nr:hypothetical protein CBM2595_A30232 [Cupriavidus taiwanensis]SOZ61526.1 hypothetical protein CBM2617_A40232 [Cupriavidus taiwanensis]SOZ81577.1 hypothetical protein CBM2618_A50234 [Cupriavidus taiwanensis]SOZ82910.1 hypothetical protein CBM2622_A50237 [Cupriavidus taiwanensis]SOZ91249.1 hypothetical protein CBM2621_A50232 [Cupriavidus taiwanensis]
MLGQGKASARPSNPNHFLLRQAQPNSQGESDVLWEPEYWCPTVCFLLDEFPAIAQGRGRSPLGEFLCKRPSTEVRTAMQRLFCC